MIEPLTANVCPDCFGDLHRVVLEEMALFRHGGHGATRKTTTDYCKDKDCGWVFEREVSEVKP